MKSMGYDVSLMQPVGYGPSRKPPNASMHLAQRSHRASETPRNGERIGRSRQPSYTTNLQGGVNDPSSVQGLSL